MQSVIEKMELIERVHHLIRRRATGTPAELAQRVDISEAKLYRLMDLMKSLGAPIVYSFTSQSYIYEYRVDYSFGFKYGSDINQVNGGSICMQTSIAISDLICHSQLLRVPFIKLEY